MRVRSVGAFQYVAPLNILPFYFINYSARLTLRFNLPSRKPIVTEAGDSK